ncbi:MAG: protein kinase [Verrucomicrobia bacterium]|nr:protein kinase [Verrucomicrobiota bacterium]
MNPDREAEISIFNAAIELISTKERARYLDEACKDNPDRRRRIEALLQAYEASPDLLETDLTASDGTDARTHRLTEDIGATIGRYKLLQKIGEGGFGVVYMAEQREPVKRRVALKIIKLGMDTKQVVARFEAERQALALMDHANIAKVLDGGATETGRPYFVMELVRGIPLTQFCDENHLTTEERLKLFVQVCQALHHAHQKGIIHRDIKPTNILVTRQDDRPVPKVIDFGIAKATQQELTEKTLFTQFRQLIGTPAYMSPEQAQWGHMDIDTRSDVYSLGVLLYELLTGRTPLDSRDLMNAGYDEICRRIREQEPPLPSTRVSTLADAERGVIAERRRADPRRLGTLLRGDLDWIVMKALEKDRTRRYESTNDFAEDLQRFLASEPVTAAPPNTLYRFRRFTRRHKVSMAVAGIIVALLISATALSSWLAVRALDARTTAQKEADRARRAGEAEAKQRALAQTNEAAAKELLVEARHEQGKALMASAQRLKEQKHFFEANLTAARALGFAGYGRPTNDLIFETNFPKLLKLGSSEESDARLFIEREPDYAPLWRSSVGRHHPNPLGDDYFQTGHTALWQIAFGDNGTRLLTKLVTSIRDWSTDDGSLLNEFADSASAAISPNGDFIVSNDERQFTLRDPKTGQVLRRLEGDTGSILSIAAAKNGSVLALGLTNEIRLYDKTTGSLISTVTGLTERAEVLALDPSGRWLAFAGTNAWIQLCEAATGRPIRRLEGHDKRIRTLAFAPSGDRLASGGDDHKIHLWSTDTWSSGSVLEGHTHSVHSLVFHPNRPLLISGGADHTLRVWNVGTSRLVRTLSGHDNVIHAVAIDPQGTWLASGCQNGVVLLWNLDTYQPRFLPQTHADGISSVRVSPDGSMIASGSYDRTVRLWSSRTGELFATLRGHHAPIHSVDFSPDGSRLASLDADAVVMLWDVERAERLRTLDPGKPTSRASWPWMRGRTLVFHPDGRRLVSRQGDLPIIWDVTTGERLKDLEPSSQTIVTLALDPSGSLLAAADAFAGLTVWRLPNPKPYLKHQFHDVFTLALAFDRDGTHLIRTSPSGFEFLNAESGKLERTLGAGSLIRGNMDVVFNSTGTIIAAAGQDNAVHIWHGGSGNEIARLIGHKRPVSSVDLAPDNSFVVSGALDGAVILWDLASNRARVEWTMGSAIVGLAFDKTGRRLMTAGSSGQLEVREVETGELVARHDGLLPQGPINWKAVVGTDPLYIGSTDGKLQGWNAAAGVVELETMTENFGVTRLALHPERGLLAALYDDRSMRLRDVQTWTELRSWKIGITADSLAFHPEGRRVAITSRSKSIEFWNVETGTLAHKFEIERGQVSGSAISSDGGHMITGGDQLRIWNLSTAEIEFQTAAPTDVNFVSPTVSPEGSVVAVGRLRKSGMRDLVWRPSESVIEVRELPNGRLLTEFPLATGGSDSAFELPSMAFSPDGNALAVAWQVWDSPVRLYHLGSSLRERVDWAGYAGAFHWAGNPPVLDFVSSSTNLFAVAPGLRMRPGPADRFLRLQQDASDNPTLLRALYWRAYLAENLGSARVLLDKLKQVDPNPREEQILIRMFLREARRARRNGLVHLGLRRVEQAAESMPEHGEVWAELANAALLNGRYERASEAVSQMMRLQPKAALTWRLSGDLAVALNEQDRALSAYNTAVELARGADEAEWKASLKARSKVLQQLGRLAEARSDHLQGLGIPERDPGLSASQLDLTTFYNAALDEDLHGIKGNNLKEFLPSRTRAFGGVSFDVRGLIHLSAPAGGFRQYPRTVTGIPVKSRVQRLHVLHAAAFDNWYPTLEDSRIAEYALNYADGTRHVFGVENGVHLHDWVYNTWEPDQVAAVKKSGVVWEGKNDRVAHNPEQVALFKASWDNPHSEKPVESIDLIAPHKNAAPFILGITVE